jgi:hypothetical protein
MSWWGRESKRAAVALHCAAPEFGPSLTADPASDRLGGRRRAVKARGGATPRNVSGGLLSSAQKLGLRTGHVGRPGESAAGTGEADPKGSFDVVGKNFHDFRRQARSLMREN